MAGWRHLDSWAKALALAVFVLGIALMVTVFVWAARLFQELSTGKELLLQSSPTNRQPVVAWAVHWVTLVTLLLALGYIASLIAARGANLYLSVRTQEQRGEDQRE